MALTLVQDAYFEAAQEDRCAPRVKLEIPAMLRPSGAHAFATTLVDLSLGGFAAKAVTGMPAGTLCWLSVGALKGLQAEVVWNDGQTVGCAFSNLLNPAVFETLVTKVY
jgi:PilZ domain